MRDKFSVIFVTLGAIIASAVIAFGFAYLGWMKSYDNRLIEVKGLSEKTVRADVGEMSIRFTNNGYANLEELYSKRISDKEKVMAFLKSQGVTDDEVVNYSMETNDYDESDKTISADGVTRLDHKTFFRSNDTITVKTTQLGKIEKIRSEIAKLSASGILLTYHFSYRLTRFIDVKLEMMKEASENAYENAKKFVEPYDFEIGEVVYLKQGEVTIRAEDENEQVSAWDSQEGKSINKKLRLVVRAGYTQRKNIRQKNVGWWQFFTCSK